MMQSEGWCGFVLALKGKVETSADPLDTPSASTPRLCSFLFIQCRFSTCPLFSLSILSTLLTNKVIRWEYRGSRSQLRQPTSMSSLHLLNFCRFPTMANTCTLCISAYIGLSIKCTSTAMAMLSFPPVAAAKKEHSESTSTYPRFRRSDQLSRDPLLGHQPLWSFLQLWDSYASTFRGACRREPTLEFKKESNSNFDREFNFIFFVSLLDAWSGHLSLQLP
jgi:hypothetical protein